MSAWRFAPFLIFLSAVQLGLWAALCSLFLPRPGQKRLRLALGLAQGAIAVFWISFIAFARNGGVQLPGPLRAFVVEPLLAFEALSFPLMLALTIPLSLARRVKPPNAGQLAEPRRIFLKRAATGVLGVTGVAALVGIEQAELLPVLSRHEVPIQGLHPDLDGLTLVQLSDIHAGALMSEERMRRIADYAATLQADLVLLTGDLLDVSARAAGPFSRAFRDLHGKLGTFAVLGNHDYFAGPDAVARALHDADITLLRNSGARIQRGGGSLYLGGVDDPSHGAHGVDPARALRAAAPEEPRLMLAHRPSLFESCAREGAQLVLSGHTHGGQIALSPRWSLARVLGPHTMGLYAESGSHLYVHRGMGTVGPAPLRLGSPPEIALLTLRRV